MCWFPLSCWILYVPEKTNPFPKHYITNPLEFLVYLDLFILGSIFLGIYCHQGRVSNGRPGRSTAPSG